MPITLTDDQVTLVETAVQHFLDYLNDYPQDYTDSADSGPQEYDELVADYERLYTTLTALQGEVSPDTLEPGTIPHHIDTVAAEAGLGVMGSEGILGIVWYRENVDDRMIARLTAADVTDLYDTYIDPAINHIEEYLLEQDTEFPDGITTPTLTPGLTWVLDSTGPQGIRHQVDHGDMDWHEVAGAAMLVLAGTVQEPIDAAGWCASSRTVAKGILDGPTLLDVSQAERFARALVSQIPDTPSACDWLRRVDADVCVPRLVTRTAPGEYTVTVDVYRALTQAYLGQNTLVLHLGANPEPGEVATRLHDLFGTTWAPVPGGGGGVYAPDTPAPLTPGTTVFWTLDSVTPDGIVHHDSVGKGSVHSDVQDLVVSELGNPENRLYTVTEWFGNPDAFAYDDGPYDQRATQLVAHTWDDRDAATSGLEQRIMGLLHINPWVVDDPDPVSLDNPAPVVTPPVTPPAPHMSI